MRDILTAFVRVSTFSFFSLLSVGAFSFFIALWFTVVFFVEHTLGFHFSFSFYFLLNADSFFVSN